MSIAPPSNTRTSTTTDSWITPKWLIDRLGPFDLDPCSCIPQPWPCAEKQYTIEDDGLLQPWIGLVWCNPPYGRALGDWLSKCAAHNNGIALVFARTETKAYFNNVWPYATAILFLKGRLRFCLPDGSSPRKGGNSGGPSVLIGYGDVAHERLYRLDGELGKFVSLNKGKPHDESV